MWAATWDGYRTQLLVGGLNPCQEAQLTHTGTSVRQRRTGLSKEQN